MSNYLSLNTNKIATKQNRTADTKNCWSGSFCFDGSHDFNKSYEVNSMYENICTIATLDRNGNIVKGSLNIV